MAADQNMREVRDALSGLLIAADFAADPDVWPAFKAHVERQTGRQYDVGPATMRAAIAVGERLRAELSKAIGEAP